MENFWDYSVWGTLHIIACLLLSLLAANALKERFKVLKQSLVPTSVLGGGILLLISGLYKLFTGDVLFDTAFFGGRGMATLEIITYHTLALGFIASALKSTGGALTKKRTVEIFNTGVTTVSTYLLQAVFGFAVTIGAAWLVSDFFAAAGVLLPFGFGQGTGQALNYGNIYEREFGFDGGKSFGLTIAAMGFISAALGGVVHLNLLKRRGKIKIDLGHDSYELGEEVQTEGEFPMQGSMDKMTVQIALVVVAYFLAYGMMFLLGLVLPGMRSVIYGFNFLLGVLSAAILKLVMNLLMKKKIMKRRYANNFLMTRVSNFFFDVMVVAGIAAIRLGILEKYWGVILVLSLGGLILTYAYNYFVAHKLFPEYAEEQFLTMYGMLTGTASTGIVLLREIDGKFETPAADNMVYQNLPAIVFGFPMMLLATLAPVRPGLTMTILVLFFCAMNVLLFRSFLFKKKK